MDFGNWNLNKNLDLTYDEEFMGLPLMVARRPFVVEYLEVLHGVMRKALEAYGRVFAFRCDPRLPQGMEAGSEYFRNDIASRFVASLKAKIRHNRDSAASTGMRVHDTEVRYFWVREVGDAGRVHYHFVFFLNADAFRWLGDYESPRSNTRKRVMEAWASALGMPVEETQGLVHFPDDSSYLLRRDDPASLRAFFWRASYMCKAETKQYGHGHHGYGLSRG
ncbi:MAG: inovirus Gp2 family protein [Burkholderiales bacterium]|nr:inovirus Gp2 family protein [Burkholderiales bacterium]